MDFDRKISSERVVKINKVKELSKVETQLIASLLSQNGEDSKNSNQLNPQNFPKNLQNLAEKAYFCKRIIMPRKCFKTTNPTSPKKTAIIHLGC